MEPLQDYQYHLPDRLVARYPLQRRSQSRLLVVDCRRNTFTDSHFVEIDRRLPEASLLIVNNTRVVPARFYLKSPTSGRTIECLFLRFTDNDEIEIMAKPLKHLKVDMRMMVESKFELEVVKKENGMGYLRLLPNGMDIKEGRELFLQWLDRHGKIPLPPYLRREAEQIDSIRYQTIFADKGRSVAAPTAGLHFDQPTLTRLARSGIEVATLNLQVGAGTFAPIRCPDIKQHPIHEESFALSEDLLTKLERARAKQRKIVAVGTTVVRAIESAALRDQWVSSEQTTRLMITAGFRPRIIDSLLTNFHLPCSSLLVMVSALAGKDLIRRCYDHAVLREYRFYSYGDAMYLADIR